MQSSRCALHLRHGSDPKALSTISRGQHIRPASTLESASDFQSSAEAVFDAGLVLFVLDPVGSALLCCTLARVAAHANPATTFFVALERFDWLPWSKLSHVRQVG